MDLPDATDTNKRAINIAVGSLVEPIVGMLNASGFDLESLD